MSAGRDRALFAVVSSALAGWLALTATACAADGSILGGYSDGGTGVTGDAETASAIAQPDASPPTPPQNPADAQPLPPPSAKLTVNVTGPGTVESVPAGLVCLNAVCSGTFPPGTSVKVVPKPGDGAVFTAWGGACAGVADCTVLLATDSAVTATMTAVAGTYVGNYTLNAVNYGCLFQNKGTMTVTVSASGGTFASTVKLTGMELEDVSSCSPVGVGSVQSKQPSPTTLTGTDLTGTWQTTSGSDNLSLPFKATWNGAAIQGGWTCNSCNGSYSLTRQ